MIKIFTSQNKQRLEALNDGVIAIAITIMVLSIQVPQSTSLKEIWPFMNEVFIFLASFVLVGQFWDRHRRLFDHLEGINGRVVWRNLLFLFFLAVTPLFTRWIILHPNDMMPVTAYGIVFLLINWSFGFLAASALPLCNAKAKNVMKLRPGGPYAELAMLCIGIFMIMILAFFFPKTSSLLFLGFPILSAVLSLWFDQDDMKAMDKTAEEIRMIKWKRLRSIAKSR